MLTECKTIDYWWKYRYICEMVCDFTGKVSVLIVCVYVTCLPGSYEFAVVKLYWEKNLFKLQNTKKSL